MSNFYIVANFMSLHYIKSRVDRNHTVPIIIMFEEFPLTKLSSTI